MGARCQSLSAISLCEFVLLLCSAAMSVVFLSHAAAPPPQATSALDAESEKAVQDALSRLMQGRTCVVVAHRLSTIRNAHSIAVLGGGELLEQGAHDELIAKHGKYATLVALRSEHE